MRKFFYFAGMGFFLIGILGVILGSLLVTTGNVGAGILFWIGLATLGIGWIVVALAKTKECQNCLHRNNVKVLLCPHCEGVVI